MLNGNVKIINTSLTFFIKVPTQKARFNLYKRQILKNQIQELYKRSEFFFLHYCLVFRSSHIWLDIQARDVHLKTLRRYSGSWVLGGHSEGTWKALGHLESTRRALGDLRYMDTQTLRTLRHSGTRALKALGHSRYFI